MPQSYTKPYFGNRPAFHNPNVEIRSCRSTNCAFGYRTRMAQSLTWCSPPAKIYRLLVSFDARAQGKQSSSLRNPSELLWKLRPSRCCDGPWRILSRRLFEILDIPCITVKRQKIRFVEHLLAARQQTPEFPYVHWDWAYDFRRTLRDQREKEIAKQETTRPLGNVLAALGPSMTAEQWCEAYRDIKIKAHIDIGLAIESGMDVQEACDNAEKVIKYYRENSPVFSLTLSQSTADYFYLDKVARELSLKKNNVKISHLDGQA